MNKGRTITAQQTSAIPLSCEKGIQVPRGGNEIKLRKRMLLKITRQRSLRGRRPAGRLLLYRVAFSEKHLYLTEGKGCGVLDKWQGLVY